MFRSLVLGLLGALVLLVALHRRSPEPVRGGASAVIVDVSQRAAGDSVVDVLGLADGERVIAIGDVAARTDQVVDAWRRSAPGGYLDLTVEGGGAVRRVLVLVHR